LEVAGRWRVLSMVFALQEIYVADDEVLPKERRNEARREERRLTATRKH
jgi:hypothetical protein